jgi:hypothetical protein
MIFHPTDLDSAKARPALRRSLPVLFRRMSSVAAIILSLGFLFVTPANAAVINYGDFNGATVSFLDVTEESTTDPLPLYGAPTLVGDSLFFSPLQFDARSTNQAPPIDTTDGHLSFDIVAHGGQAITLIDFLESGAFEVDGFVCCNTDDTSVRVNVVGNVTVLEIDGDSNIVPLVIPLTYSFVFDVGGQNLATNQWRYLSEGPESGAWVGQDLVNIPAALAAANRPFTVGATRVNVNLDNILRAKSEPLGHAMIDKKLFLEITTTVPEPASVALFGLAFLAAVGLVRRRVGG